MLGVCCTCQEPHDVRESRSDFSDSISNIVDIFYEGESASYVMADHDPSFGGGRCEGSGTTPQVVYKDKE